MGHTRRDFLKTTAAGAAGALSGTLGFPMVSRAQTVTLKMQGAWGAKDIFNDFAVDYVKRVNEMAGGRLKIDYLVEGAVVKAFRVQDAVHKGVLDAGHQVTVYWYGKSKAASLFGTGPVFGQNAHHILSWIAYGGGQKLYEELIASLKRANETLAGQLARARAALSPEGKPQERVLTAASFLVRYGPGLVDTIEVEVARWAGAP